MVIQVIDCSTNQSTSMLKQQSPSYKSSVEKKQIRDTISSHTRGERQVQRYFGYSKWERSNRETHSSHHIYKKKKGKVEVL